MSTLDLTAGQLATIRDVSAWFWPTDPALPAPAEADPDGSVLRLCLEQLEPLLPEISAALDACGAAPAVPAHLAAQQAAGSDDFELLRLLAVGHYLSCRPVWRELGYPGRVPHPIGPRESAGLDNLLEAPRRRGAVYRPTPS